MNTTKTDTEMRWFGSLGRKIPADRFDELDAIYSAAYRASRDMGAGLTEANEAATAAVRRHYYGDMDPTEQARLEAQFRAECDRMDPTELAMEILGRPGHCDHAAEKALWALMGPEGFGIVAKVAVEVTEAEARDAAAYAA